MEIRTLLLLAACSCGVAENPGPPGFPGKADDPDGRAGLPVAEAFPIDGEVDLSALSTTSDTLTFSPGGVTTDVTWGLASDDRNLYLAVRWTDATFHSSWFRTPDLDFDQITLLIDDDGDGKHEAGEDFRWVRATAAGSFFRDAHLGETGEDEEDIVGDGLAALRYRPELGAYDAEFLIPLADDAEAQDSALANGARYQLVVWNDARPLEGKLDTASLFESWEPLAIAATGGTYAHPELPTDLEGLIVFTSTHEHPAGEIYTFDPGTGEIDRVTENDLAENNVSLSHDRTRIAFHAQADPDDITTFDIYTIRTDGTEMTQLTHDDSANAHPAWSPDDARIIYSPIFPDPPSVVVMTASGERLRNITPSGVQDHDAEYLPDGRIVMKTDRWSTAPLFQIAVIEEDGTGARQVTTVDHGVDHDPVGDDEFALFERFMKPTHYGDDPEAITTPWDLVEARLDGSAESTVLADVWVNSLPVYDPSGQYILYRRGPSYQEANLLTRDGVVLGRLIPGITQISYIDWK